MENIYILHYFPFVFNPYNQYYFNIDILNILDLKCLVTLIVLCEQSPIEICNVDNSSLRSRVSIMSVMFKNKQTINEPTTMKQVQ